jgi:hypothetical protein
LSHLKEKELDLSLIIKHMEEMRKGGITMFVEKNIEDLLVCVNHINNALARQHPPPNMDQILHDV